VVAVEVVVNVEIIRISTVIVGLTTINMVAMREAAMIAMAMINTMVEEGMVVVAAMVVAILKATTNMVVVAKCAARWDTSHGIFGRDSRRTTGVRKNLLVQHMDPMALTPTGMMILEQPIMSQAS
jgi:hypothetical protein